MKTHCWLILLGLGAGILVWNGFSLALDATNTQQFCTSCHQMNIVTAEYRQSTHFQNSSGVQASCADCHVPEALLPKLQRKLEASNDLYHAIAGTIDTEQLFESRRLLLAERVWQRMKANDSATCRSCHVFNDAQLQQQKTRARAQHQLAIVNHETCIDCHQGIAHKPVRKQQSKPEDEDNFLL